MDVSLAVLGSMSKTWTACKNMLELVFVMQIMIPKETKMCGKKKLKKIK